MKRTFLMTGLAVLTLAFFMTGCNSMKKLQTHGYTEGSDRNSRCGLC